MVQSSYSRISLRLLSKRKKHLIFQPTVNICNSSGLRACPISRKSCLDEKRSSFSFLYNSKCLFSSLSSPVSQVDIITRQIRSDNISNESLNKLKSEVFSIYGQINETNFDAVFLGLCSNEHAFSVGTAFFKHLYNQGKCNLATCGKYFRLCYDCADKCTENDKAFIITLSQELLSKYHILDFRTCEHLALGLSITSSWKVALELLEMCKFSAKPSTKMYSVIIQSAFRNNEFDIGWHLMHEVAMNNKRHDVDIFKSWMEASCFTSEAYLKMLQFLEQYDIHPTEDLADFLLNSYKKINKTVQHCKVTLIHPSGRCQSCFKQLKPVVITDEEFSKLKDAFLKPVLLGKDIFLKSKPQEFNSFLVFLDKIGKIDVVLDGLNIAYAKDKHKINKVTAAQLLCDVVGHFVEQSKKVAVIGRKHMNSWPKEKINYIKTNSSLFLADNVSADDPLLLYAAMNSGLGTYFVSRDQMRGHKFLLKDSELMSIFSRWQQKHQLYLKYVTPKGSVLFVTPLPYLLSVQETTQSKWHVPISSPMDNVPAHLVAKNTKWLCLS